MWPDAMIFIFWMLNFKPAFLLSSFTFTKWLFRPFLLSAIKVVSSAFLRLLVFLLAISIPGCQSSNLAFCTVNSAYTLNSQGDNIQLWCIPFSILNQSVVPCPVLLLDQHTGGREGGLVFPSLEEFSTVYYDPHSQRLLLELSCFFHDPADVGNLISGSFAFSKSSLNIWKFLDHILLKPSLKDFEHDLASMWNEHIWMTVWTFFGVALLWDWN